MAALAIATGLRGRSTVEVVESAEIGIVGVGEATFPSIRNYNKLVGIAEAEFLRATRGTYKLGIEFRDWRVKGERYFHTFGDFGQLVGPDALWGQYRRVSDPSLGHAPADVVSRHIGRCVEDLGYGRYEYCGW